MTDPTPETFLARIIAATREELAARQARTPLDELRARAADAPAPRDFAAALRPAPGGPARLIGEVKRASPSKGLLAERFEPVALARAYEAGGAAAISVLTEPRFFLGSLEHLTDVRAAVSLPVLRKDFLLDPYQVFEARVAGADAALLILAMLDDALAADLLSHIRSLGMEALVEAHDAAEVERAVALGARVIGVNSRDLRTFTVDTAVVQRLRPLVPQDRVFIAESGVTSWRDVARARVWGADGVLVGEALMRAADPVMATRELAAAPGGATALLFEKTGRPFVKICGLAQPEQALVAMEAGADAIGLVFAPKAQPHRLLTPERAAAIVSALPPHGEGCPNLIGIFFNASVDEIEAIIERVRLGALQLTGEETAERCAAVANVTGLPILKTMRLRTEADIARIDEYVQVGATILLDAVTSDGYGGSGQRSDWALARLAAQRWPVILAGGLTPENVASAVSEVAPRGVDVSSGVESIGPEGRAKDLNKIRAFIATARGAVSDS